jgi:uncharacterized protein (TIGR02453 family)
VVVARAAHRGIRSIMSFTGLNPDAIAFFGELAENNTREWWLANKHRYDENVRTPFELLAGELEPEFGGLKIFRPYRDVRFSADKTPYKTHIGMVSSTPPVAFYLQLSAEGLLVGGGVYDVPPPALARFREVVADEASFARLEPVLAGLTDAGFTLMTDDALRTAPRGYPVDHPRIDLLRLKHLAVGLREPVEDWWFTPVAYDEISSHWRAVAPWLTWLAENLGDDLVRVRAR